ncbi:uncharacterized protein LOC117176037 [Belonocnema kinseyi]|uniref:uncharacterized protein LOC117176037 n=1 Tax=Belonocnema kinseyi TaxID=2817044 RepID=UPI00143CFB16|nr:uncharacterized protein LOC117176037 [Belonocnema kinseyi]
MDDEDDSFVKFINALNTFGAPTLWESIPDRTNESEIQSGRIIAGDNLDNPDDLLSLETGDKDMEANDEIIEDQQALKILITIRWNMLQGILNELNITFPHLEDKIDAIMIRLNMFQSTLLELQGTLTRLEDHINALKPSNSDIFYL